MHCICLSMCMNVQLHFTVAHMRNSSEGPDAYAYVLRQCTALQMSLRGKLVWQAAEQVWGCEGRSHSSDRGHVCISQQRSSVTGEDTLTDFAMLQFQSSSMADKYRAAKKAHTVQGPVPDML